MKGEEILPLFFKIIIMFKNQKIKPLITIEEIFNNIDDEHIFSHYIGDDFIIGEVINSPLREDNVPSFGVFDSRKYGILLFKDLATGEKGDAVIFVKKLFGYDSVYKACSRIALDFGLDEEYKICDTIKSDTEVVHYTFKKQKPRVEINLQIKIRSYNQIDINYWNSYNVSLPTLKKYNVFPISHYFINLFPVKCVTQTYCYFEKKDNIHTYKIYQPFARNKKEKWKGNVDSSVWQGWEQLPESGEMLIITKSYKDIMSILDSCGIPSTAIQSESYIPKESVVNELKNRFTNIYILFDNDYDNPDNPGRASAIKLSENFNIPYIEIPSEFKSKDFSDLVYNHGVEKAKNILNQLINNKKPN